MPAKAIQTIRRRQSEWTVEPIPPQKLDVFDWIEKHKGEMGRRIPDYQNFLSACGEANVAPQKRFNELMESFLHPSDEAWEEFRSTFRHTVLIQTQRRWIPEVELEKFIENALFSSFSRMVRQSVPKKLA